MLRGEKLNSNEKIVDNGLLPMILIFLSSRRAAEDPRQSTGHLRTLCGSDGLQARN